jgi:hypothetical protein
MRLWEPLFLQHGPLPQPAHVWLWQEARRGLEAVQHASLPHL